MTKSEFYQNFCKASVKKLSENAYLDDEIIFGENSIELMLRKVRTALINLNTICFICMRPLGKTFAKMRTCGDQMCDFSFKESNLGNIFNEIKKDPDIAHFLVETTYLAFVSNRASDLTEPFPSFLLKNREMRPETGNLEYIQVA